MATNIRDPRSIITPDAFSVSDELLGTPLAGPGKRLASILIDLIVIGILTVMTAGLSFVIWGIVGLFLLQMAFRKPTRKLSRAAAFLFRGSMGCLGFMILSGVGIGYLAVTLGGDEFVEETAQSFAEGFEEGDVGAASEQLGADLGLGEGGGLGDLIAGLGGMLSNGDLSEVDDPELARQMLFGFLDGAAAVNVSGDELVDVVESLVGEDPSFTDEDPAVFSRQVLVDWAADRGVDLDGVSLAVDGTDPDAAEADDVAGVSVADMSDAEVMRAWSERFVSGDTARSDPAAAALRSRMVGIVAGDSIGALQENVSDLNRDLSRTSEDLTEAREAAAAESAGFTALLRDVWEQLGSAFGLWSIYFTVSLTLFRGRTVGKFVTRTRVLRLDGEPLNWWASFERCGGYFAGIATGLLGFAQVYWDPNRQCVHDKIVGTVVVLDGVAAIPGAWREAAGQDDASVASGPGDSTLP